ncbi:MAG TPA: sugar phosphate isomerase/epimerase family protein [Verrucomicrobiae bacterium]|nr:sugar phosphate isomerase/epimerase family protein [Verrucomicrobiae bacterium]
MNHPAHDLGSEIQWIAEAGFDFIDLTLEPPGAGSHQIDVKDIRAALKDAELSVVGHTAYYLPLCSPFESIRRAAVDELKSCLQIFAGLGARWMNIHPDRQAPLHSREFIIERNLQTISELLAAGGELGVGIMIENLPNGFNNARELSQLLEPAPELGLHLDIGHANLLTEQNTTEDILAHYGSRLRHVHLHDNRGGSADLHLPLGAGNLDIAQHLRALQNCNYDGTITLEVFTPDRRYLEFSREILRQLWDKISAAPKQAREP